MWVVVVVAWQEGRLHYWSTSIKLVSVIILPSLHQGELLAFSVCKYMKTHANKNIQTQMKIYMKYYFHQTCVCNHPARPAQGGNCLLSPFANI